MRAAPTFNSSSSSVYGSYRDNPREFGVVSGANQSGEFGAVSVEAFGLGFDALALPSAALGPSYGSVPASLASSATRRRGGALPYRADAAETDALARGSRAGSRHARRVPQPQPQRYSHRLRASYPRASASSSAFPAAGRGGRLRGRADVFVESTITPVLASSDTI